MSKMPPVLHTVFLMNGHEMYEYIFMERVEMIKKILIDHGAKIIDTAVLNGKNDICFLVDDYVSSIDMTEAVARAGMYLIAETISGVTFLKINLR